VPPGLSFTATSHYFWACNHFSDPNTFVYQSILN
jgi:hypothetical protein